MTTPSSAAPAAPATPSQSAQPTNPAATPAAAPASAPAAATPPASASTAANPAVNPAAAQQTPVKEGAAPAVAADTNPAAGAAPQGAPETYEIKQPDQGLKLDGGTLEAFTGLARELNLTNENANKVAELFRSRFEADNLARVDSLARDWAAQTTADPEIGGARMPETMSAARKALTLGRPEFVKLLAPIAEGGSGIGAHPEVIRFLASVGKALSEDKFVAAKGAPTAPVEQGNYAQRLYGTPKT